MFLEWANNMRVINCSPPDCKCKVTFDHSHNRLFIQLYSSNDSQEKLKKIKKNAKQENNNTNTQLATTDKQNANCRQLFSVYLQR